MACTTSASQRKDTNELLSKAPSGFPNALGCGYTRGHVVYRSDTFRLLGVGQLHRYRPDTTSCGQQCVARNGGVFRVWNAHQPHALRISDDSHYDQYFRQSRSTTDGAKRQGF